MGGVDYELFTGIRLNFQPISRLINTDFARIPDMNVFLFEPADHNCVYDLDCIVRKDDLETCWFIIRYNKHYYTEAAIESFVTDCLETIQHTQNRI